MKNLGKVTMHGMCLIIALGLTMPAGAQEKKISQENVPVAVLSAFEKGYPKSTIKGYESEVEEGKTYYEIESVKGTQARVILYFADGTIAEIEKAVAVGVLPEAVKSAIGKEFVKAKIANAENVTKGSRFLL